MAHHIFKIVVQQIDSTETIILKHYVDLVYPCFHQFNEKIFQRFPMLRDAIFKMYWIDSENDHITIYNEEDFHFYLESNPGKLYIDAKTGKVPSGIEQPTKKTVQFNESLVAPESVPMSPPAEPEAAAESFNQNIPRSSSTPNLPRWPNVVCDGCDKGIYGFRYKCIQCYNYDLCSDCERKVHTHHSMLRLAEPMDISKLDRIFSKVIRHGGRRCFNKEPAVHDHGRIVCGVGTELPAVHDHGRIVCGVGTELPGMFEHHPPGKHSDRKHRRCSNRNVNANDICYITGRTGAKSTAAGTSSDSKSAGNEQPKATSANAPKVHVFNFPGNTGSAAGGIDVNFPKVAEDCAKFTNTILTTLADIIDPYITGKGNANPTTTTTTTATSVSQGPSTTTTTTSTTSSSNAATPTIPENVGNTENTTRRPATATNTSSFTTTTTSSSSSSTTNNIPKHTDYLSDGIRVTATNQSDANMAIIEDCMDEVGNDSDQRYSPMQCTDWLLIEPEPEASTSASSQSTAAATTTTTTTTTTPTAQNNNNNNVGVSAPSEQSLGAELPNYRRMARELESFIASENANGTNLTTSGSSASTSSAANATGAAGTPRTQTETTAMHPNKKVNDALVEMMSMGFSNEGAWLTKLLETVDGNISEALELLHPN